MNIFDEQYNQLNTQQQKAVDTIDGPVFVMAGPGTGKTQILTLRIAQILKQSPGIEPENILALTFTNAAAYNMRERLSKIIGAQQAHRVYISTFHSFSEDMIKRYDEYFPRFQDARLVSSVEQIEIVEVLAGKHGGEYFSVFKRRQGTLNAIVSSLGKIKSEGLDADAFRKRVTQKFDEEMASDDMVYKRAYGTFKKGDRKPSAVASVTKKRDKNYALADIYEAYEETLLSKKLYDYSDLILSVVTEFNNESLFQTEIQEQFQYILVDEHQDTNDGQNAILSALITNPVWEGKPNLFVVGDTKQSIFRFAGASENSFVELFSTLEGVVTIELEHNYRSHQHILNHAHTLISKSEFHQDETTLSAFFEYEGNIEYREFHNYKTEILYVAQDIKQRIDAGESPKDVAILFRNNRDATELRTLLDVYGIRYQDATKKNLLEDPDMLKLFLLLRSVYDCTDDEVVAKTLFIDFLNFDVVNVQKILKAYRGKRDKNLSLFEMISDSKELEKIGINQKQQTNYQDFVTMLRTQKSKAENGVFQQFFSDFIRESGFLKAQLAHENSALALAKIETLFDEIRKEGMSREYFGMSECIHYLDTLKKHGITMNMNAPMVDGVQLMTFHGSKGLEFDTVYIIKALKKRKSSGEISLPFDEFSSGHDEDERRLMYVALTRAKKNCFISSYVHNEEGKEQTRSLHIDEIDALAHVDMSTWEQENSHLFADFFGESNQHILSLVDPEYMKERFLSAKLSVSALNNYMKSPLLYFFRNLVLLPQARSPFLDFGNLIHGTLEHYFNRVKEAQQILDINAFEDSFNHVLSVKVEYQDYQQRGWDTLEKYFTHNSPQFDIPVENEFRVPAVSFESIEDTSIILTGVIDKVTRTEDGIITVWDYKTGKAYSDMDASRKESLKRQATFYKLLLQHSFSGKYNFHTVVFDFIEPNSKGEYEVQTFEILSEDVESLKNEINTLVSDILSGTLLQGDIPHNDANKELLEFLEILKGPRTYEQPSLI